MNTDKTKSCLKCASKKFMDCIGPSCDKACTCMAKSCDKCSCTSHTPEELKNIMGNINKYYGLKPKTDMARFKKYAKRKSVKKLVKKSLKKLKNKSNKKSVRKNKL